MNVDTICSKNAVTAREFEELWAAARRMREHHIGYLVVVRPDPAAEAPKPVGVLTDRDIVVTVVARDADPHAIRVGDVMTPNPTVVRQSDSIQTALTHMRRMGVRRLPVVNADGELTGVLSQDDIIDSLAQALQGVAGSMLNERRIETSTRP